MKTIADSYKNELLDAVIPFWEKNSLDREHGGYFTCLDRVGHVYDTDKFLWLQARQVWMFATLYKKVAPKKDWKDIALTGASFLEKYGRNAKGDWYFSLDRQGRPLVQAYNIFSDCFAAMAFSAIHELTGKEKHALIAKTTFERIWQRQDHPKGIYEKAFPGTRPMRNFALPMILCNLSMEMAPLLGTEKVRTITDTVVHSVMEDFYQKETGLILENIGMDGQFVDSFEGRLLNPGHAIEAMWFVMNIALQNRDEALFNEAETRMYHQLEMGWDSKYGGIFYFMDSKGHPPQQLEHDQKLWWVHLETLVALAKTYAHTKNPKAREWFLKVHDYTWDRFRDTEYGGEWFGYLNRQGEVHLPLKGGKWKGCFHVPRALLEIWKTLETVTWENEA